MTHHVLQFGLNVRSRWNAMIPGDTFHFELPNGEGEFSLGGEHNAGCYVYANRVYLIVSRRLGPEFPIPRDYYVILGPGMLREVLL